MFDRPQDTQGSRAGNDSGSRGANSATGAIGGPRGYAFNRRKTALRGVQIGLEVDGFNFQEWVDLARRDSAAFEVRRRQAIERLMSTASPGQRRRSTLLQREIDAARRQAADPNESLQVLARMMCQQLSFLGEGLRSLSFSTGLFVHPKVLGERRLRARSPRP